jgi:hypothetical protein
VEFLPLILSLFYLPTKLKRSKMKRSIQNVQITRSYCIRMIAVSIMALIFILPLKLNGQGAKPNFAGTWAFNESKSNLGEGGNFRRATQITVTQDGNNLTAARVRTNQNGETTTTTEKFTLDGKESVNDSGRGPSKAIVTWSADGKALNFAITRTFDRNGETTTMKSSEVWTLTDAKTLSILSTFVMQDQENKTTLVYDKK